jgi:hypothetical protein
VSGFAILGCRDVEAYVDARLQAGIAASTLNRKLETTMIYAHVHDATVERDFRQAMARLEASFEPRSTAQTGPMPLVDEFFAHTRESISTTTQASNCV